MERRLTTILIADVAGYSHLIEIDEEETVCALKACREFIDELIGGHGGRIFGSAGDSVIAEFVSPVEAVRCAALIQDKLQSFNAGRSEDRKMRFRIGINLGDVIVEGNDLLGDGVNLAARLQAMAEPGGVNLSLPVFNQVRKRLEYGYKFLGEHKVKNIGEPVKVYRLLTAAGSPGRIVGHSEHNGFFKKHLILMSGLAVLFILAGSLAWLRPWEPIIESASLQKMALPLPDKPSIAVLPFDNLSADPGQEHVAAGLTEDIITSLSQISSLFVISRNSTFTYKGRAVKMQQVAEDLGVRYVLEGSLQKSGDRVRITAQLIDAMTGSHIWAERYERKVTDIFALQDDITSRIVIAMRIKLTEGEEARVRRKHTQSMDAWDLVSQGAEHFHLLGQPENAKARQLFLQAVEIDQKYALAYALIGWTHWFDAFRGWSDNPQRSIRDASLFAETALSLDAELPDVHALTGSIALMRGDFETAVRDGRRAVALSPNHATATALLAMILHNSGELEEAIQTYKKAMRLSPYYPAWFLSDLAFTYLDAGMPDKALIAFDKFLKRKPSKSHESYAHIGRALALSIRGSNRKAREAIVKALEADNRLTADKFHKLSLSKDKSRVREAVKILRELGLPDKGA